MHERLHLDTPPTTTHTHIHTHTHTRTYTHAHIHTHHHPRVQDTLENFMTLTFVNVLSAPSLAIIVPVISRAMVRCGAVWR